MPAKLMNEAEQKLNEVLANRLTEVMTQRGLSQHELARLAELNQSQICKLLSGEVMWSLHTLIRICQALRVSPDYMLQWRVTRA